MLGVVLLVNALALHTPNVAPRSANSDAVRRAAVRLTGSEGLDAISMARMKEDVKKLSSDAAALLEEVNGDAEKARTSYMGYTLAYVKDEMPELYDRIKTDPTHPDAHRALVEITWDAIAAFLPVTHSAKLTEAAQKKLTAVARAGCDGTSESPMSTLDVGCGNGLLLPFLLACEAPASAYRGIDVSDGMIERAKAAHESDRLCAGARFEGMSFGEVLEEKEADGSVCFDAIFFNGAMQFFPDAGKTISDAARLLSRKKSSRLVISHLNGAAFVRQERVDNPQTVLSTMPSLADLAAIAEPLGFEVVLPAFFGEQPEQIQRGLDEFYLVVLRWSETALLGAEEA